MDTKDSIQTMAQLAQDISEADTGNALCKLHTYEYHDVSTLYDISRFTHDFDDETDAFDSFGFPHFVFRDPEDVFKEFFGGRDPFEDLMDRKFRFRRKPFWRFHIFQF